MIKLFQKSIAVQLITLMVLLTIMWWNRIVHPVGMPTPSGADPLYGLMYLLFGQLPLLATIVAILLHITCGALLNNLLYNRGLIHSNSLIPMLLYIMAMGLVPEAQSLTPQAFTNLLLLLMLRILIATDNRFILNPEQLFGVAALLSSLSLFYFPLLTMALPLITILILIYKLYNWHDISLLILGFLAPYLLLFFVAFMTDRLAPIAEAMRQALFTWEFQLPHLAPLRIVTYISFGLLLLLAFFFFVGFSANKTVVYRNNGSIVVLTLIGAILLLPYIPHYSTEVQAFAIPFAFVGSLWIINNKIKSWITNVLVTLWTALCLINCNI